MIMQRLRAVCAASLFAALLALASPAAAIDRPLADAFPLGHTSCHARVLGAAERADASRRITSMAVERTTADVATERKWAKLEEHDGTPIVAANLRLRLRGDPALHTAKLACARDIGDASALTCTTPACAGGEIRITSEGQSGLVLTVGGKLKDGRFIRHYIHLDDSCEGRSAGPLVLEQAEDERFQLAAAPKEACR